MSDQIEWQKEPYQEYITEAMNILRSQEKGKSYKFLDAIASAPNETTANSLVTTVLTAQRIDPNNLDVLEEFQISFLRDVKIAYLMALRREIEILNADMRDYSPENSLMRETEKLLRDLDAKLPEKSKKFPGVVY